MPGGRIDRAAWAREVQRLIVEFDPGPRGTGNKTAFARRIGVATRTVERWIAKQTDVKIESVRDVIEALHMEPGESAALLSRIGFHLTSPPTPDDPREDPVIKQILADPQWTAAQRAELVQAQLDRIEADLVRRQQEYAQLSRLRHGQRDAS